MKAHPLVVFVFAREGTATSTRYGGFASRLKNHGGLAACDTLTCALENLAFIIHEDKTADVVDTVSGISLATAAFVYLKSWESLPEEACALTQFLEGSGVPFMDTLSLGVGVSKIATVMRLWNDEIRMPETLYIRNSSRLLAYIEQTGWQKNKQFIAKDVFGEKGRMNFLVSAAMLESIVAEHSDVHFVCQRFVPNDGDYRVGVYGGQSAFIIKRVGSGTSHLNNTSAGGKATYLAPQDLPIALRRLAESASAAAKLQISGVDIIVDKITKIPYILEVNQGSQIVTGAYTNENIALFNTALNKAIALRYTKLRHKPLKLIGRRTMVQLPELGVKQAIAKIDTGAYTSTLHAENIHTEADQLGVQTLVFDVVATKGVMTQDGKSRTIRTTDFFVQTVVSSNGTSQQRYSIKTRVVIDKKTILAVLTLSDRAEMGYPMLIGRRVIRSRFLVNVELNESYEATWSY
jgi:glutathione synthase/RimK-type ligase-like ATP-grasp enzyme